MDIIRWIRLKLDPEAAKKAEADTKAAAAGMDQSLGKVAGAGAAIAGVFAAVGAAIVAALSVRKILDFGRAAVEEAEKAEKVWNNLAGTVRAAGANWEDMEGHVRAAGAAFQDATTHTDEDYAQSLGRLITLTGDVSASTNNMGLVANVASQFFADDLAPAADLVAKVMNGNVMQLQRMGIHVKSAQEGLDILAQRSMGAATRQTETFSGRLARLNNLWGEFKEQLGDVLITSKGTTDIIETLRGVIKKLIEWVGAHRGELKELAAQGLDLVARSALVTAQALTLVVEALGATLMAAGQLTNNAGLLKMGAQLMTFTERVREQVTSLQDLWDTLHAGVSPTTQLTRALTGSTVLSRYIANGPAPGTLRPQVSNRVRETPDQKAAREAREEAAFESARSFRERARAGQEAADALHEPAANLIMDLDQQRHMFGMTTEQLVLYKAALDGATPAELAMIQRQLDLNRAMQRAAASQDAAAEKTRRHKEEIQDLQKELSLTADLAPLVGQALGAAMTGGLGPYFAGKATENLLEAAELGVRALVSTFSPFTAWQAPLLGAAAAKHLALAAAWKVASVAFGGGGRGHASASAGGGFAGAGASTSRAGAPASAAAGRSEPPPPEIHLHFDGPGYDALNPRVQKVQFGAEREARARYGQNVKIRIHRSNT